MNQEICTVSIGNGTFDNDYTFYEDGQIKRLYDRNQYDYNITEWLTASQINHNDKERIIAKCQDEYKERIKQILVYP